MTRWWRAEDTSIDHPKLLKLSDAMHRAWYTLMCVASANDGVLPPTADIAVRLREKPTKVAGWITQLVTAGLFDNDEGIFRPHNWSKRQYKSDVTDPTAADRNKRYRDRKRNERNAAVTDIRPEAEAKTESEQSRADACAPNDEDLKRRAVAIGAGISALFLGRQLPVPKNHSRCEVWLREGYAQGTILRAVENVLKRGTKPATLDYFDGAINDEHSKAPPTTNLKIVSRKVWVDEGSQEWNCHQSVRSSPVTDQRDEGGRPTGRRGWYFDSQWPAGFNDFGERIAPADQESAA